MKIRYRKLTPPTSCEHTEKDESCRHWPMSGCTDDKEHLVRAHWIDGFGRSRPGVVRRMMILHSSGSTTPSLPLPVKHIPGHKHGCSVTCRPYRPPRTATPLMMPSPGDDEYVRGLMCATSPRSAPDKWQYQTVAQEEHSSVETVLSLLLQAPPQPSCEEVNWVISV